jgi:hypothetical protein
VDEVVEGKGRSAGEAKSAATHAIAAAAAVTRGAGFDLGVSLPSGVSGDLLILSLSIPFRLGRRGASRAPAREISISQHLQPTPSSSDQTKPTSKITLNKIILNFIKFRNKII